MVSRCLDGLRMLTICLWVVEGKQEHGRGRGKGKVRQGSGQGETV